MAQGKDSGDKTEKPTPKRLRDARKKGEIPKSKEVTSTVGLFGWIVSGACLFGVIAARVAGLAELALSGVADARPVTLAEIGRAAAGVGVSAIVLLALPVAALSLLTEFVQAGPVLAFSKLKPNLSKLDPAQGLKRMVSLDNLVEVAKALLKTALIVAIGIGVAWTALPDVLSLPRTDAGDVTAVLGRLIVLVVAATVAVFVLVAALDAAYQRHSFLKKQRMSVRDIKQEGKEQEGDPHLRAHRRQTAAELAQQSPVRAARDASVLLTNPTHLAVALQHDAEAETVPTITGKAADDAARAMREAAAEAGVPILRDVSLARALYAAGEAGDAVPEALFGDVAAVLVWAETLRRDADS